MRFRVPEIFLGCFLTIAVFSMGFVVSSSYHPPQSAEQNQPHAGPDHKSPKETTEERLADYTWWLALLTGVLAISTIGLWIATGIGVFIQVKDTRILQRAYLSVVPLGIEQFMDGSDRCSCTVGFRNSGNLPSRNVRWVLDWAISGDAKLATFPIDDTKLVGNILITQGATAPKGTRYIPLGEIKKPEVGAPERWLFVWGRVRYQDGFGNERFTDFCHRYNLGALHDRKILAETARYHEYGNRTDD